MSSDVGQSAESDVCWTGDPHQWEERARDDGDAYFVTERVCRAGCRPTAISPGQRADS